VKSNLFDNLVCMKVGKFINGSPSPTIKEMSFVNGLNSQQGVAFKDERKTSSKSKESCHLPSPPQLKIPLGEVAWRKQQ
jgi:hypothetical protein